MKAGLLSNALLGIILAPVVTGITFGLTFFQEEFAGFAVPISLVAGSITLIYMTGGKFLELKATEYRFKDNNVEIYEGFLNQKSNTVPYESITDISMSRSVISRILGTGTLKLNTAGNNLYEGSISFIDDPEETLKSLKRTTGLY
jgi:uncharacterized membrane protein YdbT with pleckstrin-like domain